MQYLQTQYAQYSDAPPDEGDISEVKENYVNPNSSRPVIHKIPDHDCFIKVQTIISSHLRLMTC